MIRLLAGAVATALFALPATAQVQIQIARPAVQPGIAIDVAIGGFQQTPEQYFQGTTVRQAVFQSTWVVSGTVELQKDKLDLDMYQGAAVKTTYKQFKLKVKEVLIGDTPKLELDTVLVGPADPAQVNDFEQPLGFVQPRPWINSVQLIDGQEGVFFLTKHQSSPKHLTLLPGCAPINPLDTKYKEKLASIKSVAAILSDPVKALKAEKAEDRYDAAQALVMKYRSYPQNAIYGVDQEAIPAEESKLILQAILDGNWEQYDMPVTGNVSNEYWEKNPSNLTSQLGIYPGQNDFPQFQANNGGYHAMFKVKLKEWLDGPGAKFEVKKNVAKTSAAPQPGVRPVRPIRKP